MPHADRHSTTFPRLLGAFVLAVCTTHVLSSLSQTAFVLAALANAGASITPAASLATALKDVYGLAFRGVVPFPLVIAFGFIIALPVAALVVKIVGGGRRWLYTLAGAVMMGCLLGLTQWLVFGMSFYAGSRGVPAVAVQMLAGAVGGYVFALLLEKKRYE